MENLITVNDLKVHFVSKQGLFFRRSETVKAVDSISFSIPKGKTVGLVGESGSGKSTTGKAIARLVPISAGSIVYEDVLISDLTDIEFYTFRKKIQMIFQDPFGSLNPRMSIQSSISEPMSVHLKDLNANQRKEKVAYLLEKVGLSADMMDRFPHEFSGGQRQRIAIARALLKNAPILLLDEATSALDADSEASIQKSLTTLSENKTTLIIAHRLSTVMNADKIIVIENGHVVEQGNHSDLIDKKSVYYALYNSQFQI